MTSYINVKNKRGITKLATLIKEAGFGDVKVTVHQRSITVTPNNTIDLKAGLADLKAGRYIAFKSVDAAIKFLATRVKASKRSISRKL